MKVELKIMNNTYCNSVIPKTSQTKNGFDEVSKICAGPFIDHKDTCEGDSGNHNHIYFL